MRVSTATAVTLLALIAVSTAGTALSVVAAWSSASTVEAVLRDSVEEMMAVSQLEADLLRQRGLVAAFLLSGGREEYLDEIDNDGPPFESILGEARLVMERDDGWDALDEMRASFIRYKGARRAAIASHRAGDTVRATVICLDDMGELHEQISTQSARLVSQHEARVTEALAQARSRVTNLTLAAIVAAGATLVLGVVTSGVLYRGVFGPLRRIAVEANAFTCRRRSGRLLIEAGHIDALTTYFRELMTGISDAETGLAERDTQLLQSQKLAGVGEAVTHIAHEIRNRLALIGGLSRLVGRTRHDPKAVQSNAATIAAETTRLEHLLEQVMTFSRPIKLQLRRGSLNELIVGIADMLREGMPDGVLLGIELDAAAPDVSFDDERIEQVIVNLIRNATEAARPGTVRLSTRTTELGTALLVSDTGPGIPQSIREHIFDPFYTTKQDGNGLGLAICRQIALAHNATFTLDPTVSEGACFVMAFPADEA